MRRILPLVLATVVGTLAAGCSLVYPCESPLELEGFEGFNCFVDPEIEVAAGNTLEPADVDPEVKLGFMEEQLFAPIEDGDECPIAKRPQGGVWAMLTLRTLGIGSPTAIQCTLVAETGEVVSQAHVKARMYRSIDGDFQYLLSLLIRQAETIEEADDLFGVQADLTCSATDQQDRAATVKARVVIVRQ